MQPQDYLPFFQDLFIQTYQSTLENPVYAACLSVAVWLLTAIFYSIRIGFLNGRIKRGTKAIADVNQALATAEQQVQQTRDEMLAQQQQLEKTTDTNNELKERLAEIAGQLSSAIQTLASNPDLGQQGLSVGQGLSAEALFQRFNAANQQICENLLAQRQKQADLEADLQAEIGKLADKDQQIQTMQIRLDAQSQQLGNLTLSIEDFKQQLSQQQQEAQLNLAQIQTQYQAELSALRQQLQQAKLQVPASVVVEPPKPVVSPTTVAPVTVQTVTAPVVEVKPVIAEPKPAPVVPAPSIAAVASPSPVETTVVAEAPVPKAQPEASKPKAKGMFASALSSFSKLDKKLGGEPAPVVEKVATKPVSVSEPQSVIEKPVESVVAELKPEPVVVGTETKPKVKPAEPAKKPAGKSKGFFANAMKTFATMDQKLGGTPDQGIQQLEDETSVVEPQTAVEEVQAPVEAAIAETPQSQPEAKKGLFGKFKRK
ncbi:MAG: hypothetical protein ACKN9F_01720 [Methylomonas sp.]